MRSSASSRRRVIRSPACGMRSRRSTAASTSSWSTSRPTCSVGPLLAARARAKNLVYSMAYGDQPAIICELVDWVALLRLRADLGRQGHEFRAALPLFDAGYRLGLLRLDRGRGRQGRLQSEDVQLLHRRHQGGDRDGGGRQRHRARLPGRRPRLPARPACTIWPACSGRWRTAAACRAAASSISPPARSRTAARCSTTSATASSSPSRPTTNTRAPASSSTACWSIKSGWYGSMWRPFHMIGLETSVSVLSAVLRNEPTGTLEGVPRRRGRDRQAGPQARRDARRRGRLRRLGERHPGDEEPRGAGAADRPRPQCQAEAPVAKDHGRIASMTSNWTATSTWSSCGARWNGLAPRRPRGQREAGEDRSCPARKAGGLRGHPGIRGQARLHRRLPGAGAGRRPPLGRRRAGLPAVRRRPDGEARTTSSSTRSMTAGRRSTPTCRRRIWPGSGRASPRWS